MLYISSMDTTPPELMFDYRIPAGVKAYVCSNPKAASASSIKVTNDEEKKLNSHIKHIFVTKRSYYYNSDEVVEDLGTYVILKLPEEFFAARKKDLFLVISTVNRDPLRGEKNVSG